LTVSQGWDTNLDTKLAWESPMEVNITKRIDTPRWQTFLQGRLHPQRPHQARLG